MVLTDQIQEVKEFLKCHPNLIINADDFGKSELVNEGIIFCFKNELITSASLMANDEGTDSAIKYIKENRLSTIGAHINLTEGYPMGKFDVDLLLNPDGTWNKNSYWNPKILNRGILEKIADEINLQLDKIIDNGIDLCHLNSHHHIHTTPFLFSIFFKIAKKRNIKMRVAQTYSEGNYIKYCYRKFINNLLKSNELAFTDYFKTINAFVTRKNNLKGKNVEVMVHPSFTADFSKLVDTWEEKDFISELILLKEG